MSRDILCHHGLSQFMHLNTRVSMTVTILDFFNVGIYSNKRRGAFLRLK